MRRLGLVILGASTFPECSGLNDVRFAASAARFRDLITDSATFRDREIELLNLFDSPAGPTDTIVKILDFVANDELEDFIIYYCGHGKFANDHAYTLYLHGTKAAAPEATTLRIRTLAQDLRHHRGDRSVFIVLDACFAADAIKDFMASDPT